MTNDTPPAAPTPPSPAPAAQFDRPVHQPAPPPPTPSPALTSTVAGIAIACLTIIGTVALLTGHDGTVINTTLGIIGGLGGLHAWRMNAR